MAFTRACSEKTKGNGFKLRKGRFRLDTSKKFSTMRVVKYWKRFSREVVDASSIGVFKLRLAGALANLI